MSHHHTVTVANDGSLRIEHGGKAAEALDGLTATGAGAGIVAAENNYAHTPANQALGTVIGEPVQISEQEQKIHSEVNKRYGAACWEQRDHMGRLNTAREVAKAMVLHGKTRRRDPDYIADKSTAIAHALHDRFPKTHTSVSWEDIEAAVRAEMASFDQDE